MGIIFTGYRRKTCKSFSDCAELQHFCFCVSCNVMSNRQSTVSSSTFGMHTTFGNNFSIKYRYRQQVRQLHSSVSYNRSYNCLPLSYFEPIISEYESNPQFFYACLAKFFRRVKSLAFREIAWDTRKVDEMQGHQEITQKCRYLANNIAYDDAQNSAVVFVNILNLQIAEDGVFLFGLAFSHELCEAWLFISRFAWLPFSQIFLCLQKVL